MSDQTAPTYLEPVQELDRLRTENEALRNEKRRPDDWQDALITRLKDENAQLLVAWTDDQGHRDAILEQAEQRINDILLTIDELSDRLDDRSAALNRTAASNDTLRATLARVGALAEKWRKGYGYEDDATLATQVCGDQIRAALAGSADQETTK